MNRAACAAVFCMLAGLVNAADYRVNPDTYRERLPALQPGDRLLLEPGDYLRGLPLHNLSGSPDRPIVIEAASRTRPPRLIARAGANTVSLVNARHLVLRHLELDGRNLPVDAVKAEGHSDYADFITLEHLHIHDHAASQQNVGVSTKCPAQGWIVRNNRIERVGTGMYFGDSDGSDAFVGGLIESNVIAYTLGYNLQVKHQVRRPAGLDDRRDTTIRHNVFSKQDALPGPMARPNVLLGHFPLNGPGSEDRYLVYGNLFLHNPSEALLQAEGRVAVYNNLLINGNGDAIHIQPHNDMPRDMMIFSNTVVASGAGIQVRSGDDPAYRQRVMANVVAARQAIAGGEATHNVTLPYQPELLRAAAPRITTLLLATSKTARLLPDSLVSEFASYPGWPEMRQPGAGKLERYQP